VSAVLLAVGSALVGVGGAVLASAFVPPPPRPRGIVIDLRDTHPIDLVEVDQVWRASTPASSSRRER
jgi:hypothetical protein